MATVVRREVRKRGFFGWVFMTLFVLFNVFMLLWVISVGQGISELEAVTGAEQAGRVVGGTIGFGIILFVWTAGAVILGLFALLTRGRKTLIEEVQ